MQALGAAVKAPTLQVLLHEIAVLAYRVRFHLLPLSLDVNSLAIPSLSLKNSRIPPLTLPSAPSFLSLGLHDQDSRSNDAFLGQSRQLQVLVQDKYSFLPAIVVSLMVYESQNLIVSPLRSSSWHWLKHHAKKGSPAHRQPSRGCRCVKACPVREQS